MWHMLSRAYSKLSGRRSERPRAWRGDARHRRATERSLDGDRSLQEVAHAHDGVLHRFLVVFEAMALEGYAAPGDDRQFHLVEAVMRARIEDQLERRTVARRARRAELGPAGDHGLTVG